MDDESAGEAISRCPWCSAPIPDAAAATCPACGAALASEAGSEPQLPGVTTLDAEAILRARSESSRPRSRLLSFITGDTDNAGPREPVSPGSVAPPPDEVRREMLRLKLEAERADLESEVLALGSDAIVQGRIVLTVPGADAAPADAAPVDAEAAPADTDAPPKA